MRIAQGEKVRIEPDAPQQILCEPPCIGAGHAVGARAVGDGLDDRQTWV